MRLAVATWNGRVSPVFDVARQVEILDVEDGRVDARSVESLPGTDPQAQADRLVALGPRVLICGAVSGQMAGALARARVRVVPFMAGDVEDVILAWQEGTLMEFLMPGCCGRMNPCRGRGRGQGGRGGRKKKEGVMKIAISATGPSMSSSVDPRFGRARCFMVVDAESGASEAHDNEQNLNAAQGAGIQSGETVARLGVHAVITGNVGPKAFRLLNAAQIKVYLCGEGTVAEAVGRFKAGELKEAPAANVEGHW